MKQTVVITGASRGIGKETALRFAKEHWNVVINSSKSIEALNEVKDEILSYGADCLALAGDVQDSEFVHELIARSLERFSSIDVLVNNAGISYVGLLSDMSVEEWNRILNTNLSSVFYGCREVIPSMVSKKSGKIINVSSVWGEVGASCEVAYSATKGGIISLTKALAKELAPSNIQVNAVSFGAIDTSMNGCFSKEELEELANEIPTGRLGSSEEAGDFIYQIATMNSYVTGQVFRMDGAWI